MPKTKDYLDRTKILNRLLRSRVYSLSQLTDRVNREMGKGVAERTIEKDISDMRSEGAPIKNIKEKGYVYDPITYNHFEVKISPAHIEKIKLAATLLKQVPGLDVHEELEHLFEELDMKVDIEEDAAFMQFDTRPNYEGAKYMVDLLEAIKGKSVLSFDYQPFKYDTPKKVTVHPYLLKEFNNRWFLIGLPEDLRKQEQYEYHQYALERIKGKVKIEAQTEYFMHHKFDPAEMYRHVYGMSIPSGAKVQRVLLRFEPIRAKYVATNPLHPSQQKVKNSDSTFEFQLIHNNELEALILSYGADVEVLEPKALKNSIASRLTEGIKHYLK
jgi:predicted DNA-binding transcriptional regulator YafY